MASVVRSHARKRRRHFVWRASAVVVLLVTGGLWACAELRRGLGEDCLVGSDCVSGLCASEKCVASAPLPPLPPVVPDGDVGEVVVAAVDASDASDSSDSSDASDFGDTTSEADARLDGSDAFVD